MKLVKGLTTVSINEGPIIGMTIYDCLIGTPLEKIIAIVKNSHAVRRNNSLQLSSGGKVLLDR